MPKQFQIPVPNYAKQLHIPIPNGLEQGYPHSEFIQLAEEINSGMPEYVLGKITDALNEDGKPLKGSLILILGVAYKADVSDVRESPALNLIHLLRQKGAAVSYNDPYVEELEVDGLALASVSLDSDRLRSSDCVVITTAHMAVNLPGWL